MIWATDFPGTSDGLDSSAASYAPICSILRHINRLDLTDDSEILGDLAGLKAASLPSYAVSSGSSEVYLYHSFSILSKAYRKAFDKFINSGWNLRLPTRRVTASGKYVFRIYNDPGWGMRAALVATPNGKVPGGHAMPKEYLLELSPNDDELAIDIMNDCIEHWNTRNK
ncbi:hypothetical protein IWQ60_008684 [Tieghemiomyces parasiticus]|uniref:Uncharacterized protein n=1 Tax=Tieghemiomyces parasiticus TaxID=78921 RepID=A0A9W7ZVM1_9FUNG|nr:hypothetical protein IWQ60_008684 [Tieghemiomyces parasiticus]